MLLYYLADIAMSFNPASLLSSAQVESTVALAQGDRDVPAKRSFGNHFAARFMRNPDLSAFFLSCIH
jgi:hypothetical protein